LATTIEEKLDLLNAMSRSLGKLTNVEARLRFRGDTAEADQIKEKHDELREAIDKLRGQIADKWTADAADIEAEIRKRNTKLQDSIRSIQNDIQTAENVVKILGLVDDALQAVSGLAV
jgi:peptidoglycan hydrolase CwlO-like protein